MKLLTKLAENFRLEGNKYLAHGRDQEDLEFLGIGKGYHGSAAACDRVAKRIRLGEPIEDEEEEESEAVCLQQ